jgi:hypothetical protein
MMKYRVWPNAAPDCRWMTTLLMLLLIVEALWIREGFPGTVLKR